MTTSCGSLPPRYAPARRRWDCHHGGHPPPASYLPSRCPNREFVTSRVQDGARTHPTHAWWVLALALLLVGTGALVLGLRGHEQPLAGPASTHHTSRPRPT